MPGVRSSGNANWARSLRDRGVNLLHIAWSTISCPLVDHHKYLWAYMIAHKPLTKTTLFSNLAAVRYLLTLKKSSSKS